MKKTLLRILSLILLIATLMPFAVACVKDPPPNGDDDDDDDNSNSEVEEMDNYFFDLKVKKETDYKIVDLENSTFVNNNNSIKQNVQERNGIKVIKYKSGSKLQANLNETFCLLYATSIRFSVYSENASGFTV